MSVPTPFFDLFADRLGWALAVADAGALVELSHLSDRGAAEAVRERRWPTAVHRPQAPPLPELRRQLDEYLAGRRRTFELPLDPRGSDFQRRVWSLLTAVPFGETRSYGDLARALGRPGAARAVGRANHDNPLGVVVPCHRVIGADGSLTGYAYGLDIKRRLLEHESALVQQPLPV